MASIEHCLSMAVYINKEKRFSLFAGKNVRKQYMKVLEETGERSALSKET